MANELTTARTAIKVKLDIPAATTTFDAHLLECLGQAIPRIAPYVQYQLAEDTSLTMASGDDSFTLPVSTSTLERLYIRTSSNDVWREVDLWRQHRNKVYLSEGIGTTTYLKIIAHRSYANSDADFALLLADCPAAVLPVYYYTMSEFAAYLVGNKRQYNTYIENNGARTLDEMRDLVEFYENRATTILENEVSAEGQ